MRKRTSNQRETIKNETTKKPAQQGAEVGNKITICPTYNVSYHLANTLVYFASPKRREESIKAFDRGIAYLENLSDNATGVWNRAESCVVAYEFKNLADIIKQELEPEDIGTALACLCTLKTLIKQGYCHILPNTDES